MEIKANTIESWMKFIRFHPDLAERYMDCFWGSQLESKARLLIELEKMPNMRGPLYIFGGWYGVLTQMVLDSLDFNPEWIYSIDIDPQCEWVFNDVISREHNATAVTADCATYKYPIIPSVVINTVTEHLRQDDYDMWWNNVPRGTSFFLQGNNYFDNEEHVRCSNTIEDFLYISNVENEYIQGMSQWTFAGPNDKQYERFMVWGVKK